MTEKPTIFALIVAAGSGRRAGGGVPKQYAPVAGKPMLRHSVEALLAHPDIAGVQVVIDAAHRGFYDAAMAPSPLAGEGWGEGAATVAMPQPNFTPPPPSFLPQGEEGLLPPVMGGAQRTDSVRAGLDAIAAATPDYVLIHDAARPHLSAAMIDRILGKLAPDTGVVPALPVSDTVRRLSGDSWQEVSRDGLLRIQTPQAFPFAALHAIVQTPGEWTDEAAAWLAAGRKLVYVEGDERLAKITRAAELENAMRPTRLAIGMGYDVHALTPAGAKHVIRLGGIDIAHDHKLHGHSDADVVLHAIVDALLGALAEGDIGMHFPPGDPQWKGADSAAFLTEAMRKVAARGGVVNHLDITIICEHPKIGPHRDAIRARIAGITKLKLAQISLKATTTEKLGFTGREEGIAAQAVATLLLPEEA